MAAINKPSQPLIPPTDIEEVEEIAASAASAAIAADDTHAPLVDNLVPSENLPSYVDDVLEFADAEHFPAEGEVGKIYVAQDTNLTYRWSGAAYIQVGGASLGAGDGIEIENDIVSVDEDYLNGHLEFEAPIEDLDTIRSGAAAGASAVQPAAMETALGAKQDTLVSGTNIKTVNGESPLGSGNIEIQSGLSETETVDLVQDMLVDGTQPQGATHPYCRIVRASNSVQETLENLDSEFVKKLIDEAQDDTVIFKDTYSRNYKVEATAENSAVVYIELGELSAANYPNNAEMQVMVSIDTDTEDFPAVWDWDSYTTNPGDLQPFAQRLLQTGTFTASTVGLINDVLVQGSAAYSDLDDKPCLIVPGHSSIRETLENLEPGFVEILIGESGESGGELVPFKDTYGRNYQLEATSENTGTICVELNELSDLSYPNTVYTAVNVSIESDTGDLRLVWNWDDYGLGDPESINPFADKLIATGKFASAADVAAKQDALVSGTNIKTVNGESLLGEGNIDIQGGTSSVVVYPAQSSFPATGDDNVIYISKETDQAFYYNITDSQYKLLNTTLKILIGRGFPTEFYPVSRQLLGDPNIAKPSFEYLVSVFDGRQGTTGREPNNQLGLLSYTSTSEGVIAFFNSSNNYSRIKFTIDQTTHLAHYSTQEYGEYLPVYKSGQTTSYWTTEPTENSTKPITSGGVFAALQTKADASALNTKQETLVSGTNIKTINNQSILGSGNIDIQGGSGASEEKVVSMINDIFVKGIDPYTYTDQDGHPCFIVPSRGSIRDTILSLDSKFLRQFLSLEPLDIPDSFYDTYGRRYYSIEATSDVSADFYIDNVVWSQPYAEDESFPCIQSSFNIVTDGETGDTRIEVGDMTAEGDYEPFANKLIETGRFASAPSLDTVPVYPSPDDSFEEMLNHFDTETFRAICEHTYGNYRAPYKCTDESGNKYVFKSYECHTHNPDEGFKAHVFIERNAKAMDDSYGIIDHPPVTLCDVLLFEDAETGDAQLEVTSTQDTRYATIDEAAPMYKDLPQLDDRPLSDNDIGEWLETCYDSEYVKLIAVHIKQNGPWSIHDTDGTFVVTDLNPEHSYDPENYQYGVLFYVYANLPAESLGDEGMIIHTHPPVDVWSYSVDGRDEETGDVIFTVSHVGASRYSTTTEVQSMIDAAIGAALAASY